MLLLQTYLKNLKKKQKELSKKHPKDEAAEPVKSIATATDEEEDDSTEVSKEVLFSEKDGTRMHGNS